MRTSFVIFVWMLLAALVIALSIITVKYAIETKKFNMLTAFIIFLILSAGLFLSYWKIFDAQSLSVGIVNAIVRIMAVILTLFLGIFIFSEHITGLQWFGIALAIIAVIILII